eukprot:1003934-Amphidinium_carterae.1
MDQNWVLSIDLLRAGLTPSKTLCRSDPWFMRDESVIRTLMNAENSSFILECFKDVSLSRETTAKCLAESKSFMKSTAGKWTSVQNRGQI